jgi:hypothetical protein
MATKKNTTSTKNTKKNTKSTKKSAKSTKKKAAPVAMSLHIGVNELDPNHYGGWSGPLDACEFDATDMAAIAKSKQMAATILLTKRATRKAVLAGIRAAANTLRAGDFFFLTYAGHGGQVEDVSGEEPDKLDETWCLFDGQLIDDELYLELGKFAKGVRVFVLSDSCHSGTVTRARPPALPPGAPKPRMMPPDIARRVYQAHKETYDRLQRKVAREAGGESPDAALARVAVSARLTHVAGRCQASVILISGCQDNQTSLDGVKNGAFTERLLSVWNAGAFTGNYSKFHARILAGMPSSQSPNFFQLGPAAGFASQGVFAV